MGLDQEGMEISSKEFYRLLAPRTTVLVLSIDKEGRVNCAPFSFVMPVSIDPPILAFASAKKRHTLENIQDTSEFVVSIPPASILRELWITSKPFPKGVSEVKEAGLKEIESKMVRPPGLFEAIANLECRLIYEKEIGDHIVLFGEVLYAMVKDDLFKDGRLDLSVARPLLHVSGPEFSIPGESLKAEG